jgi:SpoVK/Ycf46/Vps4 family AAA+-type ATPase
MEVTVERMSRKEHRDALRAIVQSARAQARVTQSPTRTASAPAGTGVTALFVAPDAATAATAAEAIANELGREVYRVDLSQVVSKYIGETEKNLRQVFEEAERSGAVLFFDEADALFGRRTDVKDAHDRYANIETNYLLERLEAYQGLAILATNRRENLDDAFIRRVRHVVSFPDA